MMSVIESEGSRFDVGIIVAEVEAMLVFYRDVFGIPVVGDRTVPSGTRIVALGSGANDLKLNRPEPVPTRRPHDGAHRDALGLRYLSVYVRDAGEAHQMLTAVGYLPMGPVRSTPTGFLFFVHDPEGNIVEVVQPG